MFDLSGKVAIVTGAASGIGQAIATVFAERGANIVVADINDSQGKATASSIGKRGSAVFIHTDVSKPMDLENMVNEAYKRFGRLDILVNDAGVAIFKGSTETTEDDYRRTMDVNFKSVLFASRFAAGKMAGTGGVIINISSVTALEPLPRLLVYSASKAAILNLTVALAKEYAPLRIRVNAILPGPIDTQMNSSWPDMIADREKALRKQAEGTLVKRLGKPMDIAFGALYFASEEASFLTGSSLVIDGGNSLVAWE